MNATRILVTGARGYVGGRLVGHLSSRDHEVVGTTRAEPDRPDGWPDAVRLLRVDPTADPDLNRAALAGIDCVVHLAAANEWRSAAEPDAALFETGTGTRRLIEASIAAGVRRFIFLSTVHVYGAPLRGDLSEDTLPRPTHPYAITHLVGEAFTRAAQASGRIEGVVVRLSNGIGAPAWTSVDRWTLLGNDLARQAVETGRIVVKSPGDWRNFIALSDVCRGIERLSQANLADSPDPVFNLAGSRTVRIGHIAERLAAAAEAVLGRPVAIEAPPLAPSDEPPPFTLPIDRMAALGFQPAGDDELDRELSETVRLLAR